MYLKIQRNVGFKKLVCCTATMVTTTPANFSHLISFSMEMPSTFNSLHTKFEQITTKYDPSKIGSICRFLSFFCALAKLKMQ